MKGRESGETTVGRNFDGLMWPKLPRALQGPLSTLMAILGRLTALAPGGRAEGTLSREPVGGSRGKMEAQES